MNPPGKADPRSLEQFRSYLLVLARIQLAARPWLSGKFDASDIVHQVLLKAHNARDEFRGTNDAQMAAWLKQIFHRTLANELRAFAQAKRDAGVERSIEADLDASSCRLDAWLAADQSTPSQQVMRDERAEALAGAVAALPEDQQHVVLLRHCHGLSLVEIASQLGRTPASVAGLIRRGLQRLRELLPEEDLP